jgi:MraZ protein
MFQGHSKTNLDEKGRIIIPAKFRKHILPEANSMLNVTLGRDKCIWLFPSYEWQNVLQTLNSVNPYTKDEVAMKRQILFHADELPIDSQHRILIPQDLLQLVNIKKEVLLLGQLERIELWNPKTYDDYLNASPDSYEDVMQKVMSGLDSNNNPQA